MMRRPDSCPFCGEARKLVAEAIPTRDDRYSCCVVCYECGGQGPMALEDHPKAATDVAVAGWNRRHRPPARLPRATHVAPRHLV